VHRREVRRALLRVEVGREDAPAHALAPEELARAAGTAAAASTTSGASAAASAAAAAAAAARAPATKRAGAASRAHCAPTGIVPRLPSIETPFIYLPACSTGRGDRAY
jgi:hypothetical protein